MLNFTNMGTSVGEPPDHEKTPSELVMPVFRPFVEVAEGDDLVQVKHYISNAIRACLADSNVNVRDRIFPKDVSESELAVRMEDLVNVVVDKVRVRLTELIPRGYQESLENLRYVVDDEVKGAINTKFLELGAFYDPLTEIANREAVKQLFRRKLLSLVRQKGDLKRAKERGEQVERDDSAMAVMIIDVDYFKSVNDKHGHPIGDAVLKKVVETIQACIRDVDVFGRWGGEEFIILADVKNIEGLYRLAERISDGVRDCEDMPLGVDGEPVKVTVSVGIADTNTVKFDSDSNIQQKMDQLVEMADRALYKLKKPREGRRGQGYSYRGSVCHGGKMVLRRVKLLPKKS